MPVLLKGIGRLPAGACACGCPVTSISARRRCSLTGGEAISRPGARRLRAVAAAGGPILERTMWPQTPSELIRVQRRLARSHPAPWRPPATRPLTAACFVCFARAAGTGEGPAERAWAAAALMYADRHLVATATVRGRAGAPYRSGLLALREGRLLEAAVRALSVAPEVLIVNATGRDHPLGAGLALHLGAVLDLPSIGVTDRPLLAEGAQVALERGSSSPLRLRGMEVARLLRTRAGARPLVVHPGWRTDLDTAVALVLAAVRRARTPEPLRRARREARQARAAEEHF